MEQIKLDLKDKRILYQLDLNSRQSNTEIAKKVGLSKDVVNYRIKKLEDLKLIKGYYTIIDLSRLGYFGVRVYIRLLDANPNKEKEIIDFLINNKMVFFVAKTEGSFNIAFGSWIKDIYEFEDFYLDFKRGFKQYIGEEKISIFTKLYHFHRAYLLNKEIDNSIPEIYGREKIAKHDKTDIEILKLLAKNARIPIIEISQKLNIPPRTIAFRIKQLEKKNIIQGYRFVFDHELFGYEYYKVDLILRDTSKFKNLVGFAHINPNILYIDQTIAGSDFEFDLEVKNRDELFKIVDELRTNFPIREWFYFTLISFYKILYFPNV